MSKPQDTVKSFVQKDLNGRYTFDSDGRGSSNAWLCKEALSPSAKRECIEVHMMSTKLFATMQNLGFFCALPIDPEKTYMECKPLPK